VENIYVRYQQAMSQGGNRQEEHCVIGIKLVPTHKSTSPGAWRNRQGSVRTSSSGKSIEQPAAILIYKIWHKQTISHGLITQAKLNRGQ